MKKSENLLSFGSRGAKEGEFQSPQGIVEDSQENIYVVDEFNHRVQKFNPQGKFLLSFGKKGGKEGEFLYPTTITADKKNNLYVTDRWNHRVQKFNPQGKFLLSFGSYGDNPGQFNEPWGIDINKKEELFVVDNSNHRVQKFNPQGKFLLSFGKGGATKHFYESKSFKTGFIYQKWLKAINKFNTVETVFHQEKYKLGILEYPQNIFIDTEEQLFIADSGNNRILKFNQEGKTLSSIGLKETIDIALSRPSHIFVSTENLYYIFQEIENNLIILSPQGKKVAELFWEEREINNIYLNRKDELFIADAQNDKVWKIQLK